MKIAEKTLLLLIAFISINILAAPAAGSPKTSILVSNASESSVSSEIRNAWFGALADKYLYMRLSIIDEFNMVPEKEAEKANGKSAKYGLAVKEKDIFNAATTLKSSHILIHSYLVSEKEKNVSYYLELLSSKDKSVLYTFDETVPFDSLRSKLRYCTNGIVKAMNLKLNTNSDLNVNKQILSHNNKLLIRFGSLMVKRSGIIDELKAITNEDPNFALAYMELAKEYEKAGQYAFAAAAFNNTLLRTSLYSEMIFAPTIKNFRLAEKYLKVEKLLQSAEQKNITSILLDVEQALLYLDKNERSNARSLFNSILKKDPEEPNALLFKADDNMRAKKYGTAIAIVEKLIARNELLEDAYFLKATCLNYQKKYDLALQAALKTLLYNKTHREASLIAANINYKKKKYSEAAELYYPTLNRNAPDLKILLQASDAIEKSGDSGKALRLLNNHRKIHGGNNDFLIAAGLLEFTLKDSVNATKDLELGKSITPANGEVFRILGDIYSSKKQTAKAISMYEKARPLIKEKSTVDFSLALLYITNNQKQKAKSKLLTVLANNPTLKSANRHMADMCYDLEEVKSALVYYKKERQHNGADTHIQKRIAEIHQKRKEWLPAITEWEKYLKLSPKDQKAYLNLVDIFFIQKNSAKISSYLMQAEAFGKVSPDLFLKLAKLQSSKKEYSESIKTYSNYLKRKPSDIESLIELSGVYKKAKKDSLAAETYIKIYESNPTEHSLYLAKAGHEFYNLKKKDKAESIYNKFLLRGFKDEKTNINLSKIVYSKKDYNKTVKLLSNVSSTSKVNPDVIEMLAISNYSLKEYTQALPYLKKHLLKHPNDADIIEMNAIAYDKTKDLTNAAAMYLRFISTPKGPKHKNYSYHLTTLYNKIKFFSKSEELYRKNIVNYPDDIRNYKDLSERLLKKNDIKGAKAILEGASKSSKPTPEMLKSLAGIYYKQKSNTQAATTYRKYLNEIPKDTTAWYRLSELLYKSKNYSEAIKALKTSNAMMPNNSKIMHMMGATQFYTQDYRSASLTLERTHKMIPKNLETLQLLNKTYTHLEDTVNIINVMKKEIPLTSDKLKLHIRLSTLLLKKKRYKEALPQLEASLKLNPKDLALRKETISIYKKMKAGSKCIYHLDEGIKYHSNDAWFYFEKGNCLSLMGKEKLAIDEFKRTLAFDKKNFRAYYFLGKIYRKLGQFNLAYDNFKLATKLNSKNTKYLFHLAESAYYIGKLSEASKIVSKIIKVEPNNLEFLKLAGNIYMKNKQPAKAEVAYEKAITIDNQCGLCHTVLGRINFANKKYFKAVKHLKHTSSISSADGAHFLMLAKSLNYLKRGKDAQEYYIKAMVAEPDNNEAYYLAMATYLEMGKIAEAITLGDKNLNRSEDRWSLLAKGLYYEARIKHPEAIKTYKKLLAISKNDPDGLTGIGRVYLRMNKFNEALQEFGMAMVGKPEDPDIFALMAEAYFDLNNTEAAEELAQEVLKQNPTQIGANRIMGMIYVQKKQHDLAISSLERATSIENINCDLQYPLGKEYLSQMQYENAIGSLSKALECANGPKELEILKMLGDICFFKLHKKSMAKKYYQLYLEAGGDNPKIKAVIQQL